LAFIHVSLTYATAIVTAGVWTVVLLLQLPFGVDEKETWEVDEHDLLPAEIVCAA
jgi:hypothetical protein